MPRQTRRPKDGDEIQIGSTVLKFNNRKRRGRGRSLELVINTAPGVEVGAVKKRPVHRKRD